MSVQLCSFGVLRKENGLKARSRRSMNAKKRSETLKAFTLKKHFVSLDQDHKERNNKSQNSKLIDSRRLPVDDSVVLIIKSSNVASKGIGAGEHCEM